MRSLFSYSLTKIFSRNPLILFPRKIDIFLGSLVELKQSLELDPTCKKTKFVFLMAAFLPKIETFSALNIACYSTNICIATPLAS